MQSLMESRLFEARRETDRGGRDRDLRDTWLDHHAIGTATRTDAGWLIRRPDGVFAGFGGAALVTHLLLEGRLPRK